MNAGPIVAHAERAHALLSASSSKQWLHCTPSARLSEQFPDSRSEYAAEGTLAHEIAELKLRKAFVDPMGPKKFNAEMKKLRAQFDEHNAKCDESKKWDAAMFGAHTDGYLDFVNAIVHQFKSPPYVAVESRLDYSMYAPEGFGTGDCVIIAGNTLYVIDLKYGKGVPVSAEGNTQMRLYALGAYVKYALLYAIDTVQMSIIQPRLGEPSTESLSLGDLVAWGESIKPIAQRAFAGEGEYVPGDHCQFCRARHVCKARTDVNLALEAFKSMKPPIISNAEVGEILERARNLAKWVSDLEEYALTTVLSGGDVPGWKAVEGRGSRQYTDMDAAFQNLTANGIEEVMLYERKPLTVPSVEKLLGKAKYRELLEPFVEVKAGKPTLAPQSDKRDAITLKVTAEEAFGVPVDG